MTTPNIQIVSSKPASFFVQIIFEPLTYLSPFQVKFLEGIISPPSVSQFFLQLDIFIDVPIMQRD